jgi:hypothetical protein
VCRTVIVDRGLFDAAALFPLEDHGVSRHWLTRTKSNLKRRTLGTLGPGDELVKLEPHHYARSREPSIPRRWRLRAIRYQRPGFPPQTLLTSMLDPKAHPAREIIALYHERWEIELGYGRSDPEASSEAARRRRAVRPPAPANTPELPRVVKLKMSNYDRKRPAAK